MLEPRLLLAFTPEFLGLPDWVARGGPILNGQAENVGQGQVAGAIDTIAVHPIDDRFAIIATVNGGLWRTEDLTTATPTWKAITDDLPSQSFSALAFGPDTTPLAHGDDVIYAGMGLTSSARQGGPLGGLWRTTDGGSNWRRVDVNGDLANLTITDIIAYSQQELLVAALPTAEWDAAMGGLAVATGGLFRTADGGATWTHVPSVGGRVVVGVTDLAEDATHAGWVYAGAPGHGVLFSADRGVTWRAISDGIDNFLNSDGIDSDDNGVVDDGETLSRSVRIELAVSRAPSNPIYAAVIFEGRLGGVFRAVAPAAAGGGLLWAPMDATNPAPLVHEVKGTKSRDFTIGDSPEMHFSIIADETDANVVYIGSGAQGTVDNWATPNSLGCQAYSAMLFRGEFNAGPGPAMVWTPIVGSGTKSHSAPHADSRGMVWVGDDLVEIDDGGIYRLDRPNTPTADWVSLNSNLVIAETYSVAYDSLNEVIIAGNQDLGSIEELKDGTWSSAWIGTATDGRNIYQTADGGVQAVTLSQGGLNSFRYSISNNFTYFWRREFDSANHQVGQAQQLLVPIVSVGLVWEDLDEDGFVPVRYTLNAVDSSRMLIGLTGLYESTDGGQSLLAIQSGWDDAYGRPVPQITAIAYGGRESGQNRPYVAYVARGNTILVRGNYAPSSTPWSQFIRHNVPGAGEIRDIAMAPENWKCAYAVDDKAQVFRTTDGGVHWSLVTGNLRQLTQDLRCVLVYDTTPNVQGDEVVLVGGQGGVYRMLPGGNGPTWTGFNDGLVKAPAANDPALPNVTVNDLVYDSTDKILIAGTMGRGVWVVNNADTILGAPGVLRLTGSNGQDAVTLRIDPENANYLQVVDSIGTSIARARLNSLNNIEISGLAGEDTVTLDFTNGLFAPPAGITLNGGIPAANDHLILKSSATNALSIPIGVSGNPNGIVMIQGGGQSVTITYSDIPDVDNRIPRVLDATVAAVGDGLIKASDARILEGEGSLPEVPLVKGSLGGMLSGAPARTVLPNSDMGGQSEGEAEPAEGAGGVAQAVLRRLIEEGFGAFRLSDIGGSIDTPEKLRQALDGLDATPGNVTLDVTAGGVRFDMRFTKTLSGEADLSCFGGRLADTSLVSFSLDGVLHLSADVSVHLVFGVDAGGFYIRPSDAEPELIVSNLRVDGEVEAAGTFGFLEVALRDVDVVFDPLVKLAVDLHDPGTGAGADGLIRLDELAEISPALVTAAITGNSAGDDVTLAGTLAVAALVPGADEPFDLGSARVTCTWADVAQPLAMTVRATVVGNDDFMQFLSMSSGQVVGQLTAMADHLKNATGVDLLKTQIPLLNRTLENILESTPKPLVLAGSGTADGRIAQVSDTWTSSDDTFVRLSVTGLKLTDANIIASDLLQYRSAGGTMINGIVDQVKDSSLVIRVATGIYETMDPATALIRVTRGGSLQDQVSNWMGKLAGVTQLGGSFGAPTLQGLLRTLCNRSGLDISSVEFSGSFADGTLEVRLPVVFDPAPLEFTQTLDLGTAIAGLSISAGGQLAVSIDPRLSVTMGLRLGADVPLDQRLYFVDDAQPEIALNMTATLLDPHMQGTIGFLDIGMTCPTAGGITLACAATINLHDPGTVAPDGRIVPAELIDLLTAAESQVNGQVKIDPLTLRATVGDSVALGSLTLQLHAPGDPGNPFSITSLGSLSGLLGAIDITGQLAAFEDFANITPEMVLNALPMVIQQIRDLGGSFVDVKLPLINKSVSELTDLGQVLGRKLAGAPPILTAKGLESFLNSRVNPADDPALRVRVILNPGDVRFTFALQDSWQAIFPISLDLSDGLGLTSAEATGALTVRTAVDGKLTFGFSTKSALPLEERLFLGAVRTDGAGQSVPEISFAATADVGYDLNGDGDFTDLGESPPLNFTVNVGPLALSVVNARALIRASGSLDILDGANLDGRLTVAEILSGNLSSLVATHLEGDIQAILPIDGDGGGVDNDPAHLGSADARVEVGGRIENLIAGRLDFVTDLAHHIGAAGQPLPGGIDDPLATSELSSTSFLIHSHNVSGLIANGFLNFSTLISGVEMLIDWGGNLLGTDILNHKLPFINKALVDGLDFFRSDAQGGGTLSQLVKTLTVTAGGGFGANLSDQAVLTAAELIRSSLANIPGIEPIGDTDGIGGINANDLLQVQREGNNIIGCTFLARFSPEVSWTIDSGFDLGVSFLDFQSDLTVVFRGQLTMLLGFGIDKDTGFFIRTDFSDIDTDLAQPGIQPVSGPTLSVTGSIELDGAASAKLGILDFGASFDETGAEDDLMRVDFGLDLTTLYPGKLRLGIADLLALPSLDGLANSVVLTTEAHLAVPLFTAVNSELPSLSATLSLEWGPFSLLADVPALPTIWLKNVTLQAGSFLQRVAQPVFEKVSRFNVLGPLLDNLTAPLPLVGKSLYDILSASLSNEEKKAFDFLVYTGQTIQRVVDVAGQIGDGGINFGDIPIRVPGAVSGVVPGSGTSSGVGTANVSYPGQDLPLIGGLVRELGPIGITFPVLDLSSLTALLTGGDVDFVLVQLPQLHMGASFDTEIDLYSWGCPGVAEARIGVKFGGGLDFNVNFSAGFDTTGLRHGRFWDGFYIGDFDPGQDNRIEPTDVDRPEITLEANLYAGVYGKAVLAGFIDLAQVTGFAGIRGTINIDLNDDNEYDQYVFSRDTRSPDDRHDGKLHLNEAETILASHANDPLTLFDVSGSLGVFIGVELEILYLYHDSWTQDWTVWSFTLPVKPPVIPDFANLQGSALVLTSTDSASDNDYVRIAGTNNAAGDDVWIVPFDKNNDPADGAETLRVGKGIYAEDFGPLETGANYIADIRAITLITDEGGGPLNGFGNGDDRVDVDGSLAIAVRLHGQAGNDILSGAAGVDLLDGGIGDDVLDGREGADMLLGGPGSDRYTWQIGTGVDQIVEQSADAGTDLVAIQGAQNEPSPDNFFPLPDVVSVAKSGKFGAVAVTTGGGNLVLDNVEDLRIATGGGADSITLYNLAGTDLQCVVVDPSTSDSSRGVAVDSVIYWGSTSHDAIQVDQVETPASAFDPTDTFRRPAIRIVESAHGPSPEILIVGGQSALLRLSFLGDAGDDSVTLSEPISSMATITFDAGLGNDTISTVRDTLEVIGGNNVGRETFTDTLVFTDTSASALDIRMDAWTIDQVRYSQIETVELYLGSPGAHGQDSAPPARLRVLDTKGRVNIHAGAGTNEIYVEATSGPTTISLAGLGSEVYVGRGGTVRLIIGDLDIKGGTGQDRVTYDCSAEGALTVALNPDQVTGLLSPGRLTYNAAVERVSLLLGGGDDNVTISSITHSFFIDGGAGNDISSGSLLGVPLGTQAGPGVELCAVETVAFTNADNTTATNWLLTCLEDEISPGVYDRYSELYAGVGVGGAADLAGYQRVLKTLGTTGLRVQFADAADTLYVRRLVPLCTVDVDLGLGDDYVNIGYSSFSIRAGLDAIASPLRLEGNGGNNSLLVTNEAKSATDSVHGRLVAPTIDGFGMAGSIFYFGFSSLTVKLSSWDDLMDIVSMDTSTTVLAGDGSDTVTVFEAGSDRFIPPYAPLTLIGGRDSGDADQLEDGLGYVDVVVVMTGAASSQTSVSDIAVLAPDGGISVNGGRLVSSVIGSFDFAWFEALNLVLGDNNDRVTLNYSNADLAGLGVQIYGNAGDDTVTVRSVARAAGAGGFANFNPGTGIDVLELQTNGHAASEQYRDLSQYLTYDPGLELLRVDNRPIDWTGPAPAVAWTTSAGILSADQVSLLDITTAPETHIIAANVADSLTVQEQGNRIVNVTIDRNWVQTTAGEAVLDPGGFVNDGYYATLDGLAGVSDVSTSGSYVYAASALDGAIGVFRQEGDRLVKVQGIWDGHEGANMLAGACRIVVSSNGAWAYVAARDDAAITVFARNATTGRLTFVQSVYAVALDGVFDMALAGNNLYAAGRDAGGSVVSFVCNADGTLSLLGRVIYEQASLDLARSATAWQSSTSGSSQASYAIDGNLNPLPSTGMLATTQPERQPQWQVNWGGGQFSPEIAHIVLFNRNDDAGDALTNFTVALEQSVMTYNPVTHTFVQSWEVRWQQYVDAVRKGDSLSLAVPVNIFANRLRIQMADQGVNRALSLAEVQVFRREFRGIYGIQSIDVTPDGQRIYVTSSSSALEGAATAFRRDTTTGLLQQLYVIDDDDSEVIENIDQIQVSPDGRFAYVGTFSGGLWGLGVINVFELNADGTFARCVQQIPQVTADERIALSANGSELYEIAGTRLLVSSRNAATGFLALSCTVDLYSATLPIGMWSRIIPSGSGDFVYALKGPGVVAFSRQSDGTLAFDPAHTRPYFERFPSRLGSYTAVARTTAIFSLATDYTGQRLYLNPTWREERLYNGGNRLTYDYDAIDIWYRTASGYATALNDANFPASVPFSGHNNPGAFAGDIVLNSLQIYVPLSGWLTVPAVMFGGGSSVTLYGLTSDLLSISLATTASLSLGRPIVSLQLPSVHSEYTIYALTSYGNVYALYEIRTSDGLTSNGQAFSGSGIGLALIRDQAGISARGALVGMRVSSTQYNELDTVTFPVVGATAIHISPAGNNQSLAGARDAYIDNTHTLLVLSNEGGSGPAVTAYDVSDDRRPWGQTITSLGGGFSEVRTMAARRIAHMIGLPPHLQVAWVTDLYVIGQAAGPQGHGRIELFEFDDDGLLMATMGGWTGTLVHPSRVTFTGRLYIADPGEAVANPYDSAIFLTSDFTMQPANWRRVGQGDPADFNLPGLSSVLRAGPFIFGVYPGGGTGQDPSALVMIDPLRVAGQRVVATYFEWMMGFETLGAACSLSASPDGQWLYVASPDDHCITAYRIGIVPGTSEYGLFSSTVCSDSRLATVTDLSPASPAGNGSWAVYATVSDKVLVLQADASGLLVVIQEMSALGPVAKSVASNDGVFIYVADGTYGLRIYWRNPVTGAAGSLASQVSIAGACALAVDPQDQYVYVASQVGNAIAVVRRSGHIFGLVQTLTEGVEGVRGLGGVCGLAAWNSTSPTQKYLFAVGNTSNALTVFRWDDTLGKLVFSQIYRNGNSSSLGLMTPNSIVMGDRGAVFVASSSGPTGSDGGIAWFSNNAPTAPPITYVVSFESDPLGNLSRLTVATGIRGDTVTQVRPSDVLTTVFNSSDGDDRIDLLELAGTTEVSTGSGADDVEVRSGASGTTLTVWGGPGTDFIAIRRTGQSSTTTVVADPDNDTIQVAGYQLLSPVSVDGGSPVFAPGISGDVLLFESPVTPGHTTPPTPNGTGTIWHPGNAVVNYTSIEQVEIIGPPVASVDPVAVTEGDQITLIAAIIPTAGATMSYAWDLNGDGVFGDAEGTTISLTWAQAVALGLDDDGIYNVVIRVTATTATEQLTTEAFGTVWIANRPPTIWLGRFQESVRVGQNFKLVFQETDPGNDTITTWEISWDDGSAEPFGSDAWSALHQWQTPGDRLVTVRATDEDGSYQAFKTVTVLPPVPLIVPSNPVMQEGASLSVGAEGTGSKFKVRWLIDGNLVETIGAAATIPWSEIFPLLNGQLAGHQLTARAVYSLTEVDSVPVPLTILDSPPTATFSTSLNTVYEGGQFQIIFSNVFDWLPQGNFAYSYDFEDDGVFDVVDSPLNEMTVSPADDGTVVICGRVQDEAGAQREYRARVAVREVAPTLTLIGANAVDEGIPYLLRLEASDPGDDHVRSWRVDWGDGTIETLEEEVGIARHIYADQGTYGLLVTGTDEDGSYSAKLSLPVRDVAPILHVTGLPSTPEGQTYTLSLNLVDQGNDRPQQWGINWGDGYSEVLPGNTNTATHFYREDSSRQPNGLCTIEVTAKNEEDLELSTSLSLAVLNMDPIIRSVSYPNVVSVGEQCNFAAVVDDPAGVNDPLTVVWHFGDGNVAEGTTATYAFAHSGTYTVVVVATDDEGLSTAAQMSIRVGRIRPLLRTPLRLALNVESTMTLPLNASVVGTNSYTTTSSGDLVLTRDNTGATVNKLSIARAEAFRFVAADEVVPDVRSKNAVPASDAAISRLVVLQFSAATIMAGQELSPALILAVEDRCGNLVRVDHSRVMVSIFSGTIVRSVSSGKAIFSSCSPFLAGSFTFQVFDPKLALITSVQFTQIIK